MSVLLLFLLACFGVWRVFAISDLPLWGALRDAWMSDHPWFAAFILCPLCSGFWASLALSFACPLVPGNFGPVIQAFAGAATVFLVETQVQRIEER
jgi:hypothetical protein